MGKNNDKHSSTDAQIRSSHTREEPAPFNPRPYNRWDITPSPEVTKKEIGPDHPVHKIPLEKQEKMRKKGINPVLKGEMDQATKGKGGFWVKLGMTSLGQG